MLGTHQSLADNNKSWKCFINLLSIINAAIQQIYKHLHIYTSFASHILIFLDFLRKGALVTLNFSRTLVIW